MTIKNLYFALFTTICLILAACDDGTPVDTYKDIIMQVSETTAWEPVWGDTPTTIEHMLVKEESSDKWEQLPMGSIEGFNYEHGHAYVLKVRKTTLANPPYDAPNCTYALIEIISDTAIDTPEPDQLPEKAKFKLKMVQLSPFMDLDTKIAAPFDFLTFRILNHRDEYSVFERPEFLQYYDSIVMSSPTLPNTFRIYSNDIDESGSSEIYTSQWSSYFFEKNDFTIVLNGFKDGEIIYRYAINQIMRERDFLCVDWTNGSIALSNPTNNCIYCRLATRYEFILKDTQMRNDTKFIEIWSYSASEQSPKEQETALKWLLNKYLDKPTAITADNFKTLPDDATIVETYENKTTRVALVHRDADEYIEENYFVIAEPK